MYSRLPSFILGFHGCDRSVAARLISGKQKQDLSQNVYDWLGSGMYFWENNPARALEFVKNLQDKRRSNKPIIKNPAVVGAVIDLGYCLNLLDAKFLAIVREGYEILEQTSRDTDTPMPTNRRDEKTGEILLRDLDCAVINAVHTFRAQQGLQEFDTVRSAFIEGSELFPGGTFREKNHIQVCVRNQKCIKGYFWPRDDAETTDVSES